MEVTSIGSKEVPNTRYLIVWECKVGGGNFNVECQEGGDNFNGKCQVGGGNFYGEYQVV